jgi:hypothetical protein
VFFFLKLSCPYSSLKSHIPTLHYGTIALTMKEVITFVTLIIFFAAVNSEDIYDYIIIGSGKIFYYIPSLYFNSYKLFLISIDFLLNQ